MIEHSNVAVIRNGYAAFASGDLAALSELFAEDVQWHEGGRHHLSGEYLGMEAVFGLFGKLIEVTEGSLNLELHAVFADDDHAVALVTTRASRGGRSLTVNGAHVMHMRDGKVVELWDTSWGEEDRSFGPLADRQVDGAGGARGERDDGFLAALAGDRQGPVAAFGAERLDVGSGGFGDPQSVEGEQRDEGVLGRVAEAGGDQYGADLLRSRPAAGDS